MSDERCDRDRVTAILAKCAKHRARWPMNKNPSMTIKVRDVELLGRLLEALDTIDNAKALHQPWPGPGDDCGTCENTWPCPTWQALNGANESGDDR